MLQARSLGISINGVLAFIVISCLPAALVLILAQSAAQRSPPRNQGRSTSGPSALLSFSERTAVLNNNFVAALTRLVSAMAAMPTKRTALFISDGFNRFAGQEFTAILRAYDVNDPNLRFNPRDLQPEIDKLLNLAVRDNIRFYTLDLRGLCTASAVPGTGEDASSRGASPEIRHAEMTVAFQNTDALAELAKQTGGAFFGNSNDLLKGMRRLSPMGARNMCLPMFQAMAATTGSSGESG